MSTLITGVSGFLGPHVLKRLSSQAKVYSIVRPNTTVSPEISGISEIIELDLSEDFTFDRLPTDIDQIIHLAQSRNYRNFPQEASDVFNVNVFSSSKLLDFAAQRGIKRFVYASSGGIYGYNPDAIGEEERPNPIDYYLSSKHAVELLANCYRNYFDVVILRFFFLYGPGQERMLMATLINKIIHGETISVQGKPGVVLSPTYVEDAAECVCRALQFPRSGIFNIAGDERINFSDLLHLMGELLGIAPKIEYSTNSPTGNLIGENRLAKEQLGCSFPTSLQTGLQLMIDSILNTPKQSNERKDLP